MKTLVEEDSEINVSLIIVGQKEAILNAHFELEIRYIFKNEQTLGWLLVFENIYTMIAALINLFF